MDQPRVRLGELLVRAGLITARQLDEALAEQSRVGKRLGSLLVETGLVSETQVTQILSQQLSVPWVSLHHIDFSRELLDLVPIDAVERFCLIPIYVRRVRGLGDALYVAMDDPTNTQALAEVAERSGLHVRAMIAPPSDIRAAIHAYYGIGEAPAMPSRRAVDDAEAEVTTGVLSRTEVEAKAAVAVASVQAASQVTASSAQMMEKNTRASVDVTKAVANGGRNGDDLRAIAPAKRAAVSDAGQGAADAAPVSSVAASPAPQGADTNPASTRLTAKQGAERLRRSIGALTLLDGTTIRLPGKGKGGTDEPATPTEEKLTARDLVAALRATAHGVDATEVLGENVRWERLFAALLSMLLKKHLISDWEFVEELTKG